MRELLLFLHVAGVVLWVGGMFFAHQCLRPVAVSVLEPPARLRLWRGVFARFFPWVWIAVVTLVAAGLGMFAEVGMVGAPLHWHLMMMLGFAMAAIFVFVYFSPYQALIRAVEAEAWPAGGAALGRIRQLVGINLVLGIATIATATLGRLL